MSIKDKTTLDDLIHLKGWLTVGELAKKLSVHPDTIRRWEKKGQIDSIRHPINNYRLFFLSDLIKEEAKNENQSCYLRARLFERART